MATPTPKYLFRCSSVQSNGINTPTLFAPGSLSSTATTTNTISEHNQDFISLSSPTTSTIDFGTQLRRALLWKKDQVPCPFVFFTTSPIFVVQLAAWRAARKTGKDGSVSEPDTDVRITIIRTGTARMDEREAVKFHAVQDLLKAHSVELRNRSDGSLREYADQWATVSSTLVPGPGSWNASLEDLVKNGLYQLYPQIEAANDRRDPRPSLTNDDLRKYSFRHDSGDGVGGEGNLLMRESLDTAGRVGMCFRPCVEDGDIEGDDEAEAKDRVGAVMAFVLSLRKRNLDDLAFKFWLRDHTTTTSPSGAQSGMSAGTAGAVTLGFPDADEFVKLEQHFTDLDFQLDGFAFGLSIDLGSIEKEKTDWRHWWKQNREEYRASHPKQQRQGWQDRRKDRPRDLIERRARRDSVVASPVQRQEYRTPDRYQTFVRRSNRSGYAAQSQGPRELFPGWRPTPYSVQHHGYDRRPYLSERPSCSNSNGQGYQVLSSRPGDAMVTRQYNREARVRRRRDGDGNYARERRY